MALSKTACYAVHALTCLRDQKGEPRLLIDISRAAGIPAPYLAKIMKCLIRSGLVHTKRGYRGGVALSRLPENISLLEVVEAVDGKDWIGICLLGQDGCSSWQSCPVHAAWAKIREQIQDTLRNLTLADSLRDDAKIPPNPFETLGKCIANPKSVLKRRPALCTTPSGLPQWTLRESSGNDKLA